MYRIVIRQAVKKAPPLIGPKKGINREYGEPYNTWNWSDAGWNAARVSRQIIDRVSPILDIKARYIPNENMLINTSL